MKTNNHFSVLFFITAFLFIFSDGTSNNITPSLLNCLYSDSVRIVKPPDSLGLDNFYKKYVDAEGIPIISSRRVPDKALIKAREEIIYILSLLPDEISKSMIMAHSRVGILARYEGITDLPEYKYLANDTSQNWDVKVRGFGGSIELPFTTCGEENLLCYQIDRFYGEDILIKNFGLTIKNVGIRQVDSGIDERLKKALDKAKEEGKWSSINIRNNIDEYWAQGIQYWFNTNAFVEEPDENHCSIKTRDELEKYDPGLYSIIKAYFPEINDCISCHCDSVIRNRDANDFQNLPDFFKKGNYGNIAVISPPADLKSDPFYSKYTDANGIPVISSKNVPDNALLQARNIIYFMTKMLPDNVVKAMIQSGARVGVMGKNEGTTDIPEQKMMKNDTSLNWNIRARGLGGDLQSPLTTCAEENLLCYQVDKYHAEDILIHEFAHAIHLIGIIQVDSTINSRLQESLDKAKKEGKWINTYAGTDIYEYWAEGVQDWFNVNAEVPVADGKHCYVNTRTELKEYDPDLYSILSSYFPETKDCISCHCKPDAK